MRPSSIMTLGFVLIFLGVQLNLVESYELTPRFSNFLSENGQMSDSALMKNQEFNSRYNQASYPKVNIDQSNIIPGNVKTITPPTWLCWPVLFLGAVIFLHGIGKR